MSVNKVICEKLLAEAIGNGLREAWTYRLMVVDGWAKVNENVNGRKKLPVLEVGKSEALDNGRRELADGNMVRREDRES